MTGAPGAKTRVVDETPSEVLLSEARRLLTSGGEDLGGAASRGAALLGRSALEEGIWSLFPQLKDVSGRAMFLTLPFVFDRTAARRAAVVWSRLSAVAHHHVYEMPPTTEELVAMLDIVGQVLDAVRVRFETNQAAQGQA